MDIVLDVDDYDSWSRASFESSTVTFIKQLEYIPLVSTIVGIVRIVFGVLETIFGLFALPFQLARDAYKGKSHQFILIDGLANVVRGVVALKPIIGNIILYIYDRAMDQKPSSEKNLEESQIHDFSTLKNYSSREPISC